MFLLTKVNMMTPELYETDFYAWTVEQIALLQEGKFDRLDILNLVEEIASLGNQQKQESGNLLTRIYLSADKSLYGRPNSRCYFPTRKLGNTPTPARRGKHNELIAALDQ